MPPSDSVDSRSTEIDPIRGARYIRFVGIPGGVVQLGERLVCNQEVAGSIPVASIRRRAILEIAAVVATGAIFLVFENLLDLKLPFLAACVPAWIAYLALRVKRNPAVLRDWGFRRDTFRGSAIACGVFLAVAGGGILAWRAWAGWIPIPPSTAILFVVYPAWGLMQQFFVQSLIAGNLDRLGVARWVIVPVAAVLFGLAHAPDVPLMALCAGGGLVWSAIFLRYPNLIPISITHAWLGSLVYLLILERNPWREMNLPAW